MLYRGGSNSVREGLKTETALCRNSSHARARFAIRAERERW
jgi:hypothetical protein